MSDGSEGDAVVDFENFLPLAPEREHEDAALVVQRDDRAAGGNLVFDVLAPVGDGLDKAERFLNHANERFRRVLGSADGHAGGEWLRGWMPAGVEKIAQGVVGDGLNAVAR